MGRLARVVMKNVCYHIITRGNNKKNVYKDIKDYLQYIELLKYYKRKYKYKIYGWCLMPNHVHIVMETDQISKAMHGIKCSL